MLTTLGTVILAHGTITTPPSRIWTCYQEGPENPDSPACIAAVASHGSQPLYDWNAINQGFANGDHMAVVYDGNLASGGNSTKYGGMDQVRSDWVTTNVVPGEYTVTWTNSAPHATQYFRVYITTDDWDPTQPLSWDKLTLLVETPPRPASSTDDIDIMLPNKTGDHVLFSVWQRSDSPEAFYAVSDISFGGAPPPPSDNKKVIINDDLDVKNDLTVDSTLTAGTVLLPQFIGDGDRPLGINADGELIEISTTNSSSTLSAFSKYDLQAAEENQGYKNSRIGAHFADGTVLNGISTHLLDNNEMSGSDDNSASVTLWRRHRLVNTFPDHAVYQIEAFTTGTDTFFPFSTSTVVYPGSNIIDNATYVYFIEVKYCDDCDFREVIIID